MDGIRLYWTGRMHITPGVNRLATNNSAFWLIDAIQSHQPDARALAEEFQVWKLLVRDDMTALLTMTDGNSERHIIEQPIEFTDFPEASVKLYLCHAEGQLHVLMLPEEY